MAECVLALDGLGMDGHAPTCSWRAEPPPCGQCLLGRNDLPGGVTFPEGERTTCTFAAMVLAADALSSTSPAAGLFRGECLPAALDLAEPHGSGDATMGCTAGWRP